MVGLVQAVHALYVAFVVTGPVLVLHARLRRACWRGPLQLAHGGAVAFVAIQFALDWPCPLTLLENRLAGRAPDAVFLPELAEHGAFVAGVSLVYLAVSVAAHVVVWRPREVV